MPALRLSQFLMVLVLLAAPALVLAQETQPLPLTETYTSADGTLSFDYPSGWAAADEGRTAVLATSEDVLRMGVALALEPGDMTAGIYAAPIRSLLGRTSGTLEEVIALAMSMMNPPDCEPYTEPTAITVQGREALRADQTCETIDNVLIIVALPDDMVAVVGGTTPVGSMTKFAQTLIEVAGSVTYTAPSDVTADDSLTETFTSDDGRLTLEVPSEWQVEQQGSMIFMSNGDQPPSAQPVMGQLSISFHILTDDDPPPDPTDAVSVLAWYAGESGIPFPDPERVQIGRYAMAQTAIFTTEAGVAIFAAEVAEEQFVVFSIAGSRDDVGQYTPEILAIAATMRYGADETSISVPDANAQNGAFTNADGSLMLDIPDGWQVEEQDGTIRMSNGDQPLFPDVTPGQPLIEVLIFTPEDYPSDVTGLYELVEWYTDSLDGTYTDPVSLNARQHRVAVSVMHTDDSTNAVQAVEVSPEVYVVFHTTSDVDGMADISSPLFEMISTMQYDANAEVAN